MSMLGQGSCHLCSIPSGQTCPAKLTRTLPGVMSLPGGVVPLSELWQLPTDSFPIPFLPGVPQQEVRQVARGKVSIDHSSHTQPLGSLSVLDELGACFPA